MSEALKSLNNIRTLRAHARETDLATLEEMLEKLSAVVEDRREEDQCFNVSSCGFCLDFFIHIHHMKFINHF